jgi:hypothetical protein
MSVYTNAPCVEILINNQSVSNIINVPPFGMATFDNVTFVSNSTFTAVALDESGQVLETHTIHTPQSPTSVRLSVDAPSPSTGTGNFLVLDGEDVAMLRGMLQSHNSLSFLCF